MSYEEHLADLKADFPGAKVLYAAELAVALNKSPTGLRRMIDGRKIPDLKPYGGRLGVSIINLARFLAEGDSPKESESSSAAPPSTKGRHKARTETGRPVKGAPRLRDLIAMAGRQAAFWNDFRAALERIQLRGQDFPHERKEKGL